MDGVKKGLSELRIAKVTIGSLSFASILQSFFALRHSDSSSTNSESFENIILDIFHRVSQDIVSYIHV